MLGGIKGQVVLRRRPPSPISYVDVGNYVVPSLNKPGALDPVAEVFPHTKTGVEITSANCGDFLSTDSGLGDFDDIARQGVWGPQA